jgi:hypothetical protein
VPKPGKKKKKTYKDTLAALVPESTASYTLAERQVVDLAIVKLDLTGTQGQIRKLNPADVDDIYESLVLNPPVTILSAVLWQSQPDSVPPRSPSLPRCMYRMHAVGVFSKVVRFIARPRIESRTTFIFVLLRTCAMGMERGRSNSKRVEEISETEFDVTVSHGFLLPSAWPVGSNFNPFVGCTQSSAGKPAPSRSPPPRAGMDEFIVISGQHLCTALKRVAEQMLQQGLDPPAPYTKVSCRIMRHNTPVGVRQLAAGDAQAAQGNVRGLSLVDFGRLFLCGLVCA